MDNFKHCASSYFLEYEFLKHYEICQYIANHFDSYYVFRYEPMDLNINEHKTRMIEAFKLEIDTMNDEQVMNKFRTVHGAWKIAYNLGIRLNITEAASRMIKFERI